VPQSLGEKSLAALDLPPLRVLEKDGAWYDGLDRALVAAAENGTVFFVNRMHDRRGGIAPVSLIHVTELLQRPIMAGKIQCIGTSTPASFAKLKAEGHWLAEYFEPIEIAPATEESAIAVLHSIRMTYEKFHNVSYTDDAISHAVVCARNYIKTQSLPGAAVNVIDEAGATAQLQQSSLPEEVVEAQKRIRLVVQRMEIAIANHEFEKARFYSDEERKQRYNLMELREKYNLSKNPALTIGREEIDRAVRKLLDTPGDLGSTSA
jgi:ATP-dependent Clp protease ATP-binding subunit ClpC